MYVVFFLHFAENIFEMVCDCIEPGKKGTTISVILLGFALSTILFSYLVFGDTNDYEGLRTLRMVGIVSVFIFYFTK